MNTLAITLARGGSKGVPKKNIAEIAGKPLIAWTIEAVQQSGIFDDYLISTDDEEIKDVCVRWKADTLRRYNVQDDEPSFPAFRDAVEKAEKLNKTRYDIVAMIPCTNPLRTSMDIREALARLVNTGCDSVIGVTETHPVERVKHIEFGWLRDVVEEPTHAQRHLMREGYVRNGSIYMGWRDKMMEKLFGHYHCLPLVMPPERGVNIDTPFDMFVAERLLLNMPQRNATLAGVGHTDYYETWA